MVSVEEAFKIISEVSCKLDSCVLPLEEILGNVLFEDIYAPINMPPFHQSAMDGYALNINLSNSYRIIGENKAGDNNKYILNPGEALRIYTGAMVPIGANTIAKQEIVDRSDDQITLLSSVYVGDNIRPAGEQIKKGELAIPKNTFINAGTVGYIAMLGITEVKVYRKPKIAVIATGNELVRPGNQLEIGRIYESNTFALQACLQASGFNASIITVEDDYTATRDTIDQAIKLNDVVIITGGISVGDYDFVEGALSELQIKTGFYKVKQKPGKPIFFGHKDKKLVFALPGNPAAVLSCFYVYVLSTLQYISGFGSTKPEFKTFKLKSGYTKTASLTHFLKGFISENQVEILSSQSSAMLNSFVRANCLVKMNEKQENWNPGEEVSVIMIPI